MDKYKNLPLRDGVGIILLNKENKVFVGKRIDNPNNFWQMPQGGIDKGEKNLNAAIRELEEETGIKKVELIKIIDNWMQYDLPNNLIRKIWKGKYRGQKQKWFIMRFSGKDQEINVKTQRPEFLDWKWISFLELPKVVVSFKKEVYKRIVKELELLKL
mgnify:CR=1 FL=1